MLSQLLVWIQITGTHLTGPTALLLPFAHEIRMCLSEFGLWRMMQCSYDVALLNNE